MEVPIGQKPLPGFSEKGRAGERYSFAGKQVLCDGEHYGDLVSPDAAKRCAVALNSLDMQENWVQQIADLK